ncbi:MAG: putative selenate ABC transporter substrate-binding protein [Chloroflexi bacterium]|uniref:Putative selenate ABC transporter substrate-binding protein n=2 Tax=Candidatus Thermofonsia Clade 3 TaxID=2364209 RepID=A0A2M8QA29_9CHLR|nr:MAG: putative selenate ABC transporter substrate-binding protein [Candidatus Thermofonsia Clade 3 bacterium]RMG65431.1 MAG: putative selenate ABC transporter substrate-binding protein [Chloroflexota bacterium]
MFRSSKTFVAIALCAAVALAACAAPPVAGPAAQSQAPAVPFVISAIPDQDPEKLNRLYGTVSDYLKAQLGVDVVYRPVTDYAAVVNAFRTGDVDMAWFGGLTGVQARLQVDGAQAIIQRDIDANFHSVFIANVASGIQPFNDISGLTALKGRTFTFGSESSTSGRLMPQFFMNKAGVALSDLKGEPGFSGSHDKTIKLVEAGSYEAGALNEQVWNARVAAGEVDTNKVIVLWRTPAYYDYHWVVRPDVEQKFGAGFIQRVKQAFLALDAANPAHKEILDLFGAQKFIETKNENYADIEAVARQIGKIK